MAKGQYINQKKSNFIFLSQQKKMLFAPRIWILSWVRTNAYVFLKILG